MKPAPAKAVLHLDTKSTPIDVAFKELTPQAFSFWIRMMMEPRKKLESLPFSKLAQLLGVHVPQLRQRLAELQNKGYVRVIRLGTDPCSEARIVLARRALIKGITSFIHL